MKIKLGKPKKSEKIHLFSVKNEIDDIAMPTCEPIITFTGNRQVQIEGGTGIVEFCESIVKINLGRGTVTFLGKNLDIKILGNTQTVICGEISSLEFCL